MIAPQQRLRITFAKGDAIRFSSHLDTLRLWVRSLRRIAAPLAYTQGFNPRPKLQLAAALPLGHTGSEELLDVRLSRVVDAAALLDRLQSALPVGVTVSQIREVPLDQPALQTRVSSAAYRVSVEWDEAESLVEQRIATLLSAWESLALRKGKRYDLRPLIERLRLEGVDQGSVRLGMQLAAQPGRTARPEAVLDALGMGEPSAPARYHRERVILAAD